MMNGDNNPIVDRVRQLERSGRHVARVTWPEWSAERSFRCLLVLDAGMTPNDSVSARRPGLRLNGCGRLRAASRQLTEIGLSDSKTKAKVAVLAVQFE